LLSFEQVGKEIEIEIPADQPKGIYKLKADTFFYMQDGEFKIKK